MTISMPWIVKAVLLLAKSRRGRELIFATGLTAIEISRGDKARKVYAQARATVTDPAVRQSLDKGVRGVVSRLKR
jgi:hypothetical protein